MSTTLGFGWWRLATRSPRKMLPYKLAAKIVIAGISGIWHQPSSVISLPLPLSISQQKEGRRSLPMNAYGRAMRHKHIYIMKS
eukprot:scaffold7797_cov178-Skeletonema_dohrnii-CCMP3373.AAC.2